MSANRPRIETAKPRLFTSRACWIINLFSVVLLIPLGIALLIIAIAFMFLPIVSAGVFSLCLLIAAMFCTLYFFPAGLANPYVSRLVESRQARVGNEDNSFISQIALSPRLFSGVRGFIEDADDVGRLQINEADFRYEGDSIMLQVPYGCVTRVKKTNIGWRGLWICGPRIKVCFSGLPGLEEIEFCERSALTLISNRKRANRIFKEISARIIKPG
jgi:hypothetical protein